jgi:hypothetical protein
LQGEPGRLHIKALQSELDPHEKQLQFIVLMLIRMQDIGAVQVQEVRNGGHDALAVRAVDQQDGCVLHRATSERESVPETP